MKAFSKLFYFFIFSFFVYCLLLFIWGNFFPSNFNKNLILGNNKFFLHQKFTEVKKARNVDVVFLGSSHCYRGFDPRIFKKYNINTFNLGTSSQTPIQSEYLFLKYVLKLKPKFLIFEVNPMIFSLDGLESSVDIINSHSIDMKLFEMGIMQRNVKAFNSLMFTGISEVIKINNKTTVKYQYDDKYIQGGFIEKKMAFLKVKKVNHEKLKMNNNQLDAFERLLKKINETKTRLILVQAPISKLLYKSYHDNDEFDSLMKSKGNYYNFNNKIILEDSLHFYDLDHLNQKGVDLFNNYLIKTLF